MNDMATILIVEDEPIIAQDIQYNLRHLGYSVIGIAHDSESALDMLSNRKPDLVLLDINIEGTKDGIDIARIINDKYSIPFLFLTSYSDEKTLARAKDTHPYGYIVKPFDEKDLKTSVAIAIANYNMDSTKEELSKERLDNMSHTPLSDKEFQVIQDIISGAGTSDIASKHFISINTVKYHLKNIYQKLEVSGKTELLSKIMAG